MNRWQRRIGLFATLFSAMATHTAWGAAIGIANTQALAFGKFAAGTGGTVVVNPSGARIATGGVVLLSSNLGSAAQFNITGDANATYSITLPDNGTVSLADGSGNTMSVSTFVSQPAIVGTLSGGGTQILTVGATLAVNNGQVAGSYAGSFNTTVEYN